MSYKGKSYWMFWCVVLPIASIINIIINIIIIIIIITLVDKEGYLYKVD